MYKKKRLANFGTAVGEHSPFVDRISIARPISYYVKGGIDLDGVSDRPPLPATFDDAEAVASGDVDIFTDATVSKLDLMDMASVMASESRARALKDGAGESDSD